MRQIYEDVHYHDPDREFQQGYRSPLHGTGYRPGSSRKHDSQAHRRHPYRHDGVPIYMPPIAEKSRESSRTRSPVRDVRRATYSFPERQLDLPRGRPTKWWGSNSPPSSNHSSVREVSSWERQLDAPPRRNRNHAVPKPPYSSPVQEAARVTYSYPERQLDIFRRRTDSRVSDPPSPSPVQEVGRATYSFPGATARCFQPPTKPKYVIHQQYPNGTAWRPRASVRLPDRILFAGQGGRLECR